MLYKKLILLLIFLTVSYNAVSEIWLQNLSEEESKDFYKVQEEFNDYWENKELKRGSGWKQFKRWEHFWGQRIYPDGIMPDGVELMKRLDNYLDNKNVSLLSDEYEWEEVGPSTMPENWLAYMSSGLGRLNSITIHPVNKDEYWVGSSSGGAWYSKDAGKTWNVVEMSGILSIGVSDIAISKSNPDIMYIATGDQNGASMTRGFSVGILKSTDAGNTWEQTAYNLTKNQGILISRILINPTNPDIVIAGTNQGIITTANGGDEWFKSYPNRFIRDMEYHPSKNSIIYASTGDWNGSVILKSVDGGSTFEQIYSMPTSNRLEISVSKAAPSNVYVLASSRSTNGFEGFYRSTDEGSNWNKLSSSPNILGIAGDGSSDGGQGHYDIALAVSPENPNIIFAGGIHIWKSTNSGVSWRLVNHWTGGGGFPFVHADQHWLEIDADTGYLFSANDGGLHISKDLGSTWEDLSNGLQIAQFYKISVYKGYDEILLGGTQDNGTHMAKDGEWFHVHGGDGMECKVHPENPDIMFATTYYGNLNRSTNGGKNFNYVLGPYNVQENGGWVTPYVLDPANPDIMYIGYQNLWKINFQTSSINKITSLSTSNVVNAIDVSETDNNYIYFSKNNALFKSSNGGGSWSNIYNSQRAITDIEISLDDPNTVWITLSGYTNGAKVYEIIGTDGRNISSNLPNFPVNTIVEQKNAPGTLYVGTDIGVFKRDGFEDDWQLLDGKLPKVVISELEINYSRGYIYAGTFGRGLWKTKIIDCDIETPEIAFVGETEICQGDTVILSKIGDYDDFVWSDGSANDSILITNSGIYYLMVRDETGCTSISEKISITVNPVPFLTVNIPNNGRLCNGDSLKLDASFGFDSYEWSTGDSTRVIYIDEPGDYWVKAYTSAGCSRYFDEIKIDMVPKPEKPEITRAGDTLFTNEAYAYRWFRDGNFVFNNNDDYLLLKATGEYYVEIFNEFGCSNFSDNFKVTYVSVEDNKDDNSISIIPNPNNGVFVIELPNVSNSEIVINNQLGQAIFKMNSNDKRIDIDISNQPDGVYFINIITGNQRVNKKFIKH